MYSWILYTGGIFAFFSAMGIGSNDAANAFATSVGSKALTINNAIILACIFESAGAILMGGHVVNTIRKGISDYKCFEDEPYLLMYGCMWVCFSVGAWLFIASKYEMPVSTTHSCVGAMIGMTIVLKGPSCVIWYETKETFPYIGGVSGIVLSWIISPFFSAVLSIFIFGLLRKTLLRLKNSFDMVIYFFPIIIFLCVSLNTFYIISKGAKGIGLHETSLEIACIWSFSLGGISGIISIPFIKNKKNKIKQFFDNKSNVELTNIENNMIEDTVVETIHNNAEVFNDKTEELFKTLQIFTAICDSFSHGANDVANAIGPFVTIYSIYNDPILNEKTTLNDDAYWIFALGGVGISIGLCIYGKNIINAIGFKLCKITPSRGISIELASALVIITGSRFEIPLSTTHCQIGATVGVALLEDVKKCSGINKYIFIKTILGWVLTLIFVGTTTGILVSQGVYSPSSICN